ncbi:MAG: tyrosine-type recombinase/integrase [Janthinobacterium lividum]
MGRIPTRNKNLPPRMRARHRGKVIYYFYDAGGKPRKETALGTDFVAAVRKWSDLEVEGKRFVITSIFNDVANQYIRDVLPKKKPRTQDDNLKELAYLRRFFGTGALEEIKPIHVRQYMQWRSDEARAYYLSKKWEVPANVGHVRANREIALFSHIFNFAREIGLTEASNPCAGMRKNKETGRTVYPEDDMIKLVYAVADQPTRDALDLAYLTGQRPANTLSFDERDIREGTLAVEQGKTGKRLRIQIVGELAQVIERIHARKRGYKVVGTALVVNERGQRLTAAAFRKRFDKARAAAGVDKESFQFRDLRAKAGTDKAEESGDIREAKKLLGHESIAMTEHYVRNRKGDKVGPTR